MKRNIKNIKKLLPFIFICLIYFFNVYVIYAANSSGISSPIGDSTDLKTIFTNVLNIVQTIMIMLSSVYIIYAGFMFVTAKGNPEKIKKARGSLFWGLVGAGLILTAEVLAYGISDTVETVFKGK